MSEYSVLRFIQSKTVYKVMNILMILNGLSDV